MNNPMGSGVPPRDLPPQAAEERESLWRRFLPAGWFRPAPVVSVLRFAGTIGAGGPLRSAINMAKMAGAIDRAFAVKRAKAVAIIVNSPGGSPAQSHLILRRLRALAEEKKLPIFAFVEDVAASGGYMLACAADEIIADPSSIVGSIGVVSASFGFDKLIDKIGVDRRVHTAGRSKSMLDPFRPENPDDVARLKSLQEDIHAMFIALVKERRGARLKDTDGDLFSGAFWTAERGVGLGLVDALGDLRSTLRARFGDKVKLKPINVERGFFARRLGATRFAGLDGDGSLAGDLVAALEERALWSQFGL